MVNQNTVMSAVIVGLLTVTIIILINSIARVVLLEQPFTLPTIQGAVNQILVHGVPAMLISLVVLPALGRPITALVFGLLVGVIIVVGFSNIIGFDPVNFITIVIGNTFAFFVASLVMPRGR